MRGIVHHICHTLLARSKLQVLTALSGRGFHRGVDVRDRSRDGQLGIRLATGGQNVGFLMQLFN